MKECKIRINEQFSNIQPNIFTATLGLLKKYNDVINLSQGAPDLMADKYCLEQGFSETIEKALTYYTPSSGYKDLREEIVKQYKEDYDMEIKLENVYIITSATMGMFISLNSTIVKGDEVIIFEPYYPTYIPQVEHFGGVPVFVELQEENNFQIDYDTLKKHVTSKTKGIILNSPNNPLGSRFDDNSIDAICKVAIECNLNIYADDIYTIFTYNNKPFFPINKREGMFNRTFSIRSFSKDFCQTGLRLGFMVVPEEMIPIIDLINANVTFSAPSVCQRIALFMLKERKRIWKEVKTEFEKRLNYAIERINKIPFLSALKPAGAIYIFINIKKTGMTSDEFAKFCLDKYHILVISGKNFGKSGEGFVRIALTKNVDILKEAFDRIESKGLN